MANLRPGVISEGQLKARGNRARRRHLRCKADERGRTRCTGTDANAGASGRRARTGSYPPPPREYAEVSQLAGGLAHEIRNPLSTVSLNLDLLAEDFQSPETPRDRRVLQRVERLQHEVHRLRDILESFLRSLVSNR